MKTIRLHSKLVTVAVGKVSIRTDSERPFIKTVEDVRSAIVGDGVCPTVPVIRRKRNVGHQRRTVGPVKVTAPNVGVAPNVAGAIASLFFIEVMFSRDLLEIFVEVRLRRDVRWRDILFVRVTRRLRRGG